VLDPATLTAALLSAHMIIFWLSQDSNVTPPVALTAFVAGGIAKASPMATGLTAWKIAKVLYIVPLLFAYTPFLNGEMLVALEIFFFALLGIYALSAAIEGYGEAPLPWIERGLMAGIGLALLWPLALPWHALAAAALVALMAWTIHRDRRLTAAAAAG
jgi:TRAP-type uncharacterized transport system fused permease subunit